MKSAFSPFRVKSLAPYFFFTAGSLLLPIALPNAGQATAADSSAELIAIAREVELVSSTGSFTFLLRHDVAPGTVENFLNYVDRDAYNGSFFHRSVPGFVVQGGGFTIAGDGEDFQVSSVPTDPPIQNEFNLSNVRGTVAMAKLGGDPHSATSQWFVNVDDNSADLDAQNGGFTVFAEVTGDGMEKVDAINNLQRWNFDGPFTDLPLIGYDPEGQLRIEHFVIIDSATPLSPKFLSEGAIEKTVPEGGSIALATNGWGLSSMTSQWQVSVDGGETWTDVDNATEKTLTVNPVSLDMSGDRYRMRVTDRDGGSATSDPVVLSVQTGLAPMEGDFEARMTWVEVLDFRFLTPPRFRSGDFEGDWNYERTGPDTGRIVFIYDDSPPAEYREEVELTFTSVTAANYRFAEIHSGVENSESVTEGSLDLNFDFFGLPRVGNSRDSFWFGEFNVRHFNQTTGRGWIRHQEHGWLYVAGTGRAESLWLWDHIQGDWFWTRTDVYPFLFRHNNGDGYWVYYWRGGTPRERFFYDYRQEVDDWVKRP